VYADLLTLEDVEYQLCLAAELGAAQDAAGAALGLCSAPQFPVVCPTGGLACLRCGDGRFFDVLQLRARPPRGVAAAALDSASTTCAARFPAARREIPRIDELFPDVLDNGRCYRGALGEQALTLRAVATDVEIARSELGELSESYNVAMRSCLTLQMGNVSLAGALERHNHTMDGLRIGKTVVDSIADGAAAVKDCGAAVGNDNKFGAGAGIACGGAAVEGVARIASNVLQLELDRAEARHAELMQSIAADIDEQRCFIDAEQHLVGVRSAGLRITRAAQDLDRGVLQFDNMKEEAARAFRSGRARLTVSTGKRVAPASFDFWLDERARTYRDRFRRAKRAAYLAVRAVEHEFQQSQAARGDALAAEVPDDLEQVLLELQANAATRGIGGNRPADSKVVVSLRSQLLQLADQSRAPAGRQQLTDVERFRSLLTDQRFAVYDDDGAYRGQRVPFRIAPLAALGLGDPQGVTLFSDGDCAERVWSVNASILSSVDATRGDDPAFTRIELEKADAFFSQWCDQDAHPTPYQLASVRPARNLFVDPESGGADGVGGSAGTAAGTGAFSRARIDAVFNVDRAAFSDDAFANGATTELAARGLYGDYALFFPAGVLSFDDGSERTDGLDLSRIDDILLRIDYVSVAR
jgi:hypothetical protein